MIFAYVRTRRVVSEKRTGAYKGGGGGGSKMPIFMRTYFMDDPISKTSFVAGLKLLSVLL